MKTSLNKKLTRKPIAGHSETFHLFKMYTDIFNTPAKTSHRRYGMFNFPAAGRIFPNRIAIAAARASSRSSQKKGREPKSPGKEKDGPPEVDEELCTIGEKRVARLLCSLSGDHRRGDCHQDVKKRPRRRKHPARRREGRLFEMGESLHAAAGEKCRKSAHAESAGDISGIAHDSPFLFPCRSMIAYLRFIPRQVYAWRRTLMPKRYFPDASAQNASARKSTNG